MRNELTLIKENIKKEEKTLEEIIPWEQSKELAANILLVFDSTDNYLFTELNESMVSMMNTFDDIIKYQSKTKNKKLLYDILSQMKEIPASQMENVIEDLEKQIINNSKKILIKARIFSERISALLYQGMVSKKITYNNLST